MQDAFDMLSNIVLKFDYSFIDSSEEILLNEAMILIHSKKWDGEGWLKAAERYVSKYAK
jgi:hypothetical protein